MPGNGEQTELGAAFSQPEISALERYYIEATAKDIVTKKLDEGVGQEEVEAQIRNRQLSLRPQVRINSLAVYARQEETRLQALHPEVKSQAAASGLSDVRDPGLAKIGETLVMLNNARRALSPLTNFVK